MKNARVLIVAVTILALGLAACAEAVPAPATSIEASVPVTKADLVRSVLAAQGIPTSGSDSEMDKAGTATCDLLRSTPITADLILLMATITSDSLGVSIEDGGYAVGVLIGAYCPQFEPAVNAAIGNGGN